ncbi:MAG: glycosyltransferase [Planctomycetes bacterium]|nr:glycosyltransferase [Planctomycetota bacterium]
MIKKLISIIIPTFNRSEKLKLVLEALNKQNLPFHNFEVIVIDNNSKDDTKEVVEFSIRKYKNLDIKYICEKQQGLNFARNCGVQQAQSDIVAFLDDDAIPQTGWLQTLLHAYKDTTVGCVGGRIIPSFPEDARLPHWLSAIFNGYFSGFDPGGSQIRELSEDDGFPYGANISFKKEAVLSAGLFKPKLDRCGKNLIAGGETEMCIRMYRKGWKILYNPDAIVHHLVSPNRLKKEYFSEHVKGEGVTTALIDYYLNNNNVTYYHLFCYLSNLLKYAKKLLRFYNKEDKRFYYYLRIKANAYAVISWFKVKYMGIYLE